MVADQRSSSSEANFHFAGVDADGNVEGIMYRRVRTMDWLGCRHFTEMTCVSMKYGNTVKRVRMRCHLFELGDINVNKMVLLVVINVNKWW